MCWLYLVFKNSIPDPVRRVRTTRSSTYSHPFQVIFHLSSFIPRTSQLWSSLPPTTFPESYNFSSFTSKINKLDLVSFSTHTSPHFLIFFLCRGFVIGPTSFPRHYLLNKKIYSLKFATQFSLFQIRKLLSHNKMDNYENSIFQRCL